MPTIITHSVVAVSSAFGFKSGKGFSKFLILSIVCSILPDVDVVGYLWFYIPYHPFFGHRGFFHSLFFAALISILVVSAFYRNETAFSKKWWQYVFYFFVITASHGILDALTNGGQGIALFSPFSKNRYFFPWTPIEVSPIGVKAFLSKRGLTVLTIEILWIWLPCFLIIGFIKTIRIMKRKKMRGSG